MGNAWKTLVLVVAVVGLLASSTAWASSADDEGADYEVTVTNLTRGQSFTPILVASHKPGVQLFELGQPASAQLATVAEEGATGPLAALLGTSPLVLDVRVGPGLLAPGQSRTITVATQGMFNRLSVVAMLIPTNDGFFALSGVQGPKSGQVATYFSAAYDSGSERNDESCASIPGPFFTECGGPGGGVSVFGQEEGYVHIHAGIHGIGDLDASVRDWRNPVARVQVRRLE